MSSQTLPNPNLEQEKLQLAQLDAMMIGGFKAQQAPPEVRQKWDEFLASMKKWKGITDE